MLSKWNYKIKAQKHKYQKTAENELKDLRQKTKEQTLELEETNKNLSIEIKELAEKYQITSNELNETKRRECKALF